MSLLGIQTALVAYPPPASAFDRLTFTACMPTIAATVAILAGHGPAAALQPIEAVSLTTTVSPPTEAKRYGFAAPPFGRPAQGQICASNRSSA